MHYCRWWLCIKKYNIIILAAGLGNRLRPLTIDLPKPLVNINGKPIIIDLSKDYQKKMLIELMLLLVINLNY